MLRVPFWFRLIAKNFKRDRDDLYRQISDLHMGRNDMYPYDENPSHYIIDGWGMVGTNLCCNVKYDYKDGRGVIDFGKLIAT